MAIESTRDLCLSVADAIREKKGSNELINPQDFAKEIASIEGGGSGGGELEGEYFLAKPNGRYWKFTFSPKSEYIDSESLSAEQLQALLMFCELLEPLSVVYGAAVCRDGVAFEDDLRVDGVGLAAARLGGMKLMLYAMLEESNYKDNFLFNERFFRVWKECSVKTSTVTENVPFQEYDLVSFMKQTASMDGIEVTDEQMMLMLESRFMLIPATEEEYKAARKEN